MGPVTVSGQHDQAHPGRRGHLQLALALAHAISQHVTPSGAAAAALGPDACALGTPAWRVADNLFAPRQAGTGRAKEQVCALGGAIAPFVQSAAGWSCAPSEALIPPDPADCVTLVLLLTRSARPAFGGLTDRVERNAQGLPKPGWVAEKAGAQLDLCFNPKPPPHETLAKVSGRRVAMFETPFEGTLCGGNARQQALRVL